MTSYNPSEFRVRVRVRVRIRDYELWIMDCRLWIQESGLRRVELAFRNEGLGLLTSSSVFSVSSP